MNAARTIVAQVNRLTERETECVRLVAQGLADGQIAGRLGISLATARGHVHGAAAKLGSSNRAHLVALAIGCGAIDAPRGTR